jgi:hypothetical protein
MTHEEGLELDPNKVEANESKHTNIEKNKDMSLS